ncbi:choline ABC transporter substrate-binding protein [Cobetia sp. L2A1]|uniref:choline ABC transporter substrate-binding protein n=1 Tax=Cobetia sp. L2A1 TaxID=2686360 RepID=UPI00131E5827|nr:choline ABC transporter substrate-binding protein [Cobetia sp. L2A1]
MKALLSIAALPVGLATGLLLVPQAQADVSEECRTVRFAEVGWSDITATTALTRSVLEGLGYETTSDTISVPIAYAGMKNGDFDVFLGNWMPSMASISDPYIEKGQVERPRANLEGAKYTLAVPQYVLDAGVTSVADLVKNIDKFDGRIYGIEAGNDGNMIISDMIDDDAFGMSKFEMIDSSEAGMLAEVKAKISAKEWIVFLGWEPHPMNTRFDMGYLKGADDYFGPNLGGATVYTNTRASYSTECSNVGALLANLEFTLEMENQIMGDIMDEGADPDEAASSWLKDHSQVLEAWLEGVNTVDGKPGLAAVKTSLGL